MLYSMTIEISISLYILMSLIRITTIADCPKSFYRSFIKN